MKKSLLLLLVITSAPIFAQDIVLNKHGFRGAIYLSNIQVSSGCYYRKITSTRIKKKKKHSGKNNTCQKYIFLQRLMIIQRKSYLRYNHYNDQMEFEKDGVIYYLKKEEGRTVLFTDSDVLYRVFELYGDLDYLLVKVEGENSLFVKQSSRFILPKKKQETSYGLSGEPKI